MGFFNHMKDANLGQDLKNQVSALYERLSRDGKFGKEFRLHVNDEVAKLFITHGIKAISYPNEIEGCFGEHSICIMDASITMLSNPIAISTEEWEAALRSWEI
jgi:hypothetical protein